MAGQIKVDERSGICKQEEGEEQSEEAGCQRRRAQVPLSAVTTCVQPVTVAVNMRLAVVLTPLVALLSIPAVA